MICLFPCFVEMHWYVDVTTLSRSTTNGVRVFPPSPKSTCLENQINLETLCLPRESMRQSSKISRRRGYQNAASPAQPRCHCNAFMPPFHPNVSCPIVHYHKLPSGPAAPSLKTLRSTIDRDHLVFFDNGAPVVPSNLDNLESLCWCLTSEPPLEEQFSNSKCNICQLDRTRLTWSTCTREW